MAYLSHRYLQQWTKGCSKQCHNPFCKSFCGVLERVMPPCFSSFQLSSKTNAEVVQEIIKLAKVSLENNIYWICVSFVF